MRLEGWERRLEEMIEGARERPFSWGTHDCATWAADVVQALTGRDLGSAWRGSYNTVRGAMAAVKKRGADDLCDALTLELGAPLPGIWLARRGDIVSDGDALGVCVGSHAAFLGSNGLVFQRMTHCNVAWGV